MLSRAFVRTAPLARAAVRHFGAKAAGVGPTAQVTCVLGAQWGDEGKGKLSDVLASEYDIVARFNGGANAGHTVVVGDKKFAFHLLPCGLIYPHTRNLLGNGVVVHLPSLFKELEPLEGAGIDYKGRLLISDRAHLLFDFHKTIDGVLEARRAAAVGGGSIGTTKQGIGPAYASKATRNGVRVGLLKHRDAFRARLRRTMEEHAGMYGVELDIAAELDKYDDYAGRVSGMIVDGVGFVNTALADGKRVLAEGANAAMLDLDFGTYPYVTSSSTTVGGVATGLGIAPAFIDSVVGVVKAYTTRVGGGPFPTELTDERGGGQRPLNSEGTDIGLHLQTKGGEIGVTTGRKRRCGWFDAVVVRYAHDLNNFTSLNLTKLDVLDECEEVRIGTAYVNSETGEEYPQYAFPSTLEDLEKVTVKYVTMPGWKRSTRGIRYFNELPLEARNYVKALEKEIGVSIAWIGTGPARDSMIMRGFTRKA